MTSRRLAVLADEQAWRDYAACVGMDPDIFFVPRGGTNEPARRVCARCPVRADCLEFALANNEYLGVWGGSSEQDRRRIKRMRSAESA